MFKKTMIVSVVIVLLAVPLADAEIIFFNNSNDFFQSTNIIHTEIFENSDEGFFPAEFDSFIYDGEGKIGHTTWRIDNAPGFNIPISSFVLYSPAVGIDFLKLKSPFSAIGFDFAAPYNFETIGNTIYIEVTEIDNQVTTYEYIQKDDPNGVWEYYGFVSNVGISQIKVYNDETDGILDDNFVFDNVSNSAIVPIQDTWTWVSGSNLVNQPGVYGTKGVADPANIPGARRYSVSWIDSSDNLWLFGGWLFHGGNRNLNDLWKFDGTNWTWVSGSNLVNQPGVYGTKGVANPANIPGGRVASVSWIDSSGNFWLFGGEGIDSTGAKGRLNDLWKFDGTNWTWVSGSNLVNQDGVYGTKGVANPANIPGARLESVSWIDSSGNFWLFGGSVGNYIMINDLWKFDGTNWTWVSGSNLVNQPGVYGTKGVADPANVPGARAMSVSWIDSSDNLWLFGGEEDTSYGLFNDLWKFDGANWTWVSGSNLVRQNRVYGTKGVADPSNTPGSRQKSFTWIDSSDNLWLFGGYWNGPAGNGNCNDLWKFDGTNWTWVSGSNLVNQPGVYGTKGVADPANIPGARQSSVSWIDSSGNFWLFGGQWWSYDFFNDLWKYVPFDNIDDDGDGIPNDQDACPNSDLSETVIIDSWDTGVDNVLLVDGCTISDLIAECADEADNHGGFVSSVSHTTNSLKKEGIISGKEKGKIQRCAANADIP